MKYLTVLILFVSFSAFAKDYNSGIGHISPQQEYAVRTQIQNSKAREFNLRRQRATPRYETSNQRHERHNRDSAEYYESLAY